MTAKKTPLEKLRTAAQRRAKLKHDVTEQFDELQELAKQARADGATLREIAEAGGVTHVAVKWWLRDREQGPDKSGELSTVWESGLAPVLVDDTGTEVAV